MHSTGQLNFHNIGTATDWIVMVAYFAIIMLFGAYFGKYNRSTKDFFFGGRRFSWWLIAFSIVATGVGSHSFVKYSAKGFEHGLSSSMTYINDWFFIPLFLFGWLPIIVYTKIRSIPEYFEKRFSPSVRFLATVLLMLYMIGYIGIGFLTLGKAAQPLLPENFTLLGIHFDVTLMGIITVIAVITGIYITFGGQTAVIFTDLLQGFILLFAGLFLFMLGLDYVGGFDVFWNILPASWKMPLAKFNNPPDFNFVGIFWQDGIAGSIGFLFMNMGLIMRFMATKSVNEGRKAAAFNILFMLPISAIVVGNAGWIGKAISITNPDVVPPNTAPDQIFVVVANLVSTPGVFGFIMAALTAALMSTVDTLINATSAIYINDVHRPVKKFLKSVYASEKIQDKQELSAARYSSAIITVLGVIAVILLNKFPTVYEAHGYFHSTLTPPLVVAIFMGIFWKRFTTAAVMTSFVGGVALMILGANYPQIFIAPLDHGIELNPNRPYTYIRAFYNLLVCAGVGTSIAYLAGPLKGIVAKIRSNENGDKIGYGIIVISSIIFLSVIFVSNVYHDATTAFVLLFLTLVMIFGVSIAVSYFTQYDETVRLDGLTVWSLAKAKEMFKGSKVNDDEGEIITLKWKEIDSEEDFVNFSANDMKKLAANEGDLVYLSDERKWLGGLKSFHSVVGKPHEEDGVVYITREHIDTSQITTDRRITAEKEM